MAEKVIPTPPYWSLAGQWLSGVSLDLANASVASTHPIQPRGVNEPLMFGPNIIGYDRRDVFTQVSGSFYEFDGDRRGGAGTDSGSARSGVYFDASRSSAVYGSSTVVQPASILSLACIKF